MNDFAEMTNQPFYHVIHDEICAVSQFKLKDLQLWVEATHDIEQRLLDKDKSLLDTHLAQLQAMLLLCVESSGEINHKDDVWELVCVVLAVNDGYFKHNKKIRKVKSNENTWFDSVQLLVSHGHSLESVLNMGFVQFLGFINAVQKQMVTQVNLNRLAYHGQKKDIDKLNQVA